MVRIHQIMKKLLLSLCLLQHFLLNGQEAPLVKTKEETVRYDVSALDLSHPNVMGVKGISNNKLPVLVYENIDARQTRLFEIDAPHLIPYPFREGKADDQWFSDFNVWEDRVFYIDRFLQNPDDFGHSLLFISKDEREFYLDSIFNIDKPIHSSFSSDGRYLLVGTLSPLGDHYNPEQDNFIRVYDLQNIDQGKVKKELIPCLHCNDAHLVGDQLFFTIGREDGYDGFDNKDIYLAPWGHLKDTVKIAVNTKLLAVSADGKYILGTRFFDVQEITAVILDVEQKKYQLLLGRDYVGHNSRRDVFYSFHKQRFAFDFGGYLVYVDFPESYPFDALKWRNEQIPTWVEEDFWKQFHHPLLE